ncbi:hypothetical protein XENTR_v10005946 [Xenopus tropicalis]|uniref:SPOC domain-containing protein 1 isoform X2 n=1 Tax=Xenopus tropicalis TaxID=8364 RepID=A0A8J1J2Z2_XENTR|nr:SPOC domain-containing protein 1 isoform X2 [Xenopus tropicalis]XP_031752220.1 SPOC domain-containing protein 1 isoform X2 [Xenopus tropicalis]KAE8624437.1 hypothetical protein XENTR_v10005946 [Xenopus tropicalis]
MQNPKTVHSLESGRRSPMGLFEKFQIESSNECCSDPSLHAELGPPGKSPSKSKSNDPKESSLSWEMPKKGADQGKTMHWVVNSNTLCPFIREDDKSSSFHPSGVKNVLYKVDSPYRLLGSWEKGYREIQKLEELEDTLEEEDVFPIKSETSGTSETNKDYQELPSLIPSNIRGFLEPYASDLSVKKRARDHLQVMASHSDPKGKPTRKTHISKKNHAPAPVAAGTLENVRTTTVQALSDVLLKRVKEAPDLDVQEETLLNAAKNIEQEIFALFYHTDARYKKKYRSILFNLKDPNNKVLFRRLVLGEITPQHLASLSSTEMAGDELTNWRNEEKKHVLDMIEKQEREHQQIQVTKLTHKGIIEIDTNPDQNWSLEDLIGSNWLSDAATLANKGNRDSTLQHKSHLLDLDCLICTGQANPTDQLSQQTCTRLYTTQMQLSNCLEDGNNCSPNSGKKGQSMYEGIPCTSKMTTEETGLWKGYIQMFSMKQFKVTAYKVCGYSTQLCQELPKVITSKGCISPESVWEYVDLIWPGCSQDMCLIRFSPKSSHDAIGYTRLYSYLSRKLKYGIIRSHNMEAFVVPLSASQPIPHRLHPLGGPGLEDNHPMLLIAVLLPCHPSWTSCPRRKSKKHKKVVDIPDDIFSEILADVEREEKEMLGQGLISPCTSFIKQGPPEFEGVGDEVAMQEIRNSLQYLTKYLQFFGQNPGIAGEFEGVNIIPMAQQYSFTPAAPSFSTWPMHSLSGQPSLYDMVSPVESPYPVSYDFANQSAFAHLLS